MSNLLHIDLAVAHGCDIIIFISQFIIDLQRKQLNFLQNSTSHHHSVHREATIKKIKLNFIFMEMLCHNNILANISGLISMLCNSTAILLDFA